MSSPENPTDRLWGHYSALFQRFDDLTLARWLVQTLGHFNGGIWRYSHPLVGAYKLAAQTGHQRQIWLKRLVDIPNPFPLAECCRSPLFPLITRDVVESGLICMNCNETALPLADLPEDSLSLTVLCTDSPPDDLNQPKPYLKARPEPYEFTIFRKEVPDFSEVPKRPRCTDPN